MAPVVSGTDVLAEEWNIVSKMPLERMQPFFETDVSKINPQANFRVDLLRKICDEKVWVPKKQRPSDHQSVLIFDWDDTLLCTSYLMQVQGRTVPMAARQALLRIERAACKLLEKAMTLGSTFIITNAEEGWVQESAALYMPSLTPILAKVLVISARSNHQAECAGNIAEWKKRAFLQLGRQLPPDPITNLISVGDSNFELEAARLLGEQFELGFIKTVKLQERPTPEELLKELELLVAKFQSIVEKAANMRIRLEKKPL